MKFSKLFFATLISSIFLLSCSEDEIISPIYEPLGNYDSGVIVLNQGSASSSLSFLSFDLNTTQNDIFKLVNPSIPFGQYGQDIGFIGDQAYAIMGGTNEIQIFNRYTMTSIGKINTQLNNPRYIAFNDGKIYVTNHAGFASLTDDYISVYNQSTGLFITKIDVPGGSAEKMIINAGKLYVAQGGAYGIGNQIVVINLANNTIVKSILVGDAPNSLQIANGFLWVMCGGNSNYFPAATTATSGKLLKIKLTTDTVDSGFSFTDTTQFPTNFEIYTTNAYYSIGADVYKMPLTATTLPAAKSFTADVVSLNAMAIKNNYIYIGDAPSFNSNGNVKVYANGDRTETIANSTALLYPIGKLIKTTVVGIGPAGFYFNQ
jgi:hypothetical protein